jgi:hypothetical protein
MPLYLILNEAEKRGAWCRCCRSRIQGTEETVARHMVRCAQRHYEATQSERDALSFLKPADPEYAAWAPKAFREGRLKPSRERLT